MRKENKRIARNWSLLALALAAPLLLFVILRFLSANQRQMFF